MDIVNGKGVLSPLEALASQLQNPAALDAENAMRVNERMSDVASEIEACLVEREFLDWSTRVRLLDLQKHQTTLFGLRMQFMQHVSVDMSNAETMLLGS